MISFMYENCDVIDIPECYIKNIEVVKDKIKTIIISKDFLNECKKFHEFAKYIEDDNYSENRLLTGYDICYIDYNNNRYEVNYVGVNGIDYCDNVLQKIEIKDGIIIFSWDIDDRNYIDYNKEFIEIYVNEIYKDKFDEDCIVKFWRE